MPPVRWRGLLLLLPPLLLWMIHSSITNLRLLHQRRRSKLAPGTNKKYGAGLEDEGDEEDGGRLNMTEIEWELASRRVTMLATCEKYGHSLKVPLKLYNKKLRFDPRHRLMYCENYKIGSSTWAMHLLNMKGVKVNRRTPVHLVTRKEFPPLLGRRKEKFLAREDTVAFMVVRDPFERLLSSYKDKMARRHTPNMVTWDTFGQEQRVIRRLYKDKDRNSTDMVPTFREFVRYLVGELSASPTAMKKMTRRINEHWKPVYLNCAPCSEQYSLVMKMETLTRDSLYLQQKLGLKIDVGFVRKGGKEGHTTVDRTVEAFKTVGPQLIKRLLNVYKIDFQMFGYSPLKYLNIKPTNLDDI